MNTEEFARMFPEAGPLLREKSTFLGSNGGQVDDSFRGFGAVSQHYLIPTSAGWYAYEIVGSGGILSVYNAQYEQVYGLPLFLDIKDLLATGAEKQERKQRMLHFWHDVLGVK